MINATDCVLVMGRRGCGKSYLAKRIQSIWPRRIIIDSMREYSKTGSDSFIVNSFNSFCDKIEEIKKNELKKFELIYQFDIESDISEEEFEELMRLSYYLGNVQVVIEEVQLYSTPHFLPKWLKHLLLIGRHQNISVLCTSQRPGQINKTILSQCIHIFCGQLIEKNDLNYVSAFLNEDSKTLISIPKRQFLWFSERGTKLITNDF